METFLKIQTEAYATWDSTCNIFHFNYLRNITSLALTLVFLPWWCCFKTKAIQWQRTGKQILTLNDDIPASIILQWMIQRESEDKVFPVSVIWIWSLPHRILLFHCLLSSLWCYLEVCGGAGRWWPWLADTGHSTVQALNQTWLGKSTKVL